MGSLTSSQISISVDAPSSRLYDFHRKNDPPPTSKAPLAYPSFLRRTHSNAIQYAHRCKFNDRQFEIDFRQQPDTPEIVLRRHSSATSTLWRALTPGQSHALQEGSVIRLADREFLIKKICQRFSDIDLQENLKTLSDLDNAENINLGNSCLRVHQSPILRRSKLEKSPFKMSSASLMSMGEEGEEFCRVCFGRDGGERNPLLSLCQCAGSVKNIHYVCLKRWISTKSKHFSSPAYEYYEYDLSCDLCKQRIDKAITHKGKRYVVYSESLLHPPYVVMAHRNDSSTQVREYIINFDHHTNVTLGKSKDCDLPLADRFISGMHCELAYEKSTLYLRSLNPTFGTFVNFTEATITSAENSITLMINNHLVKLQNESFNCFTSDAVRLILEQPEGQQ